MQLEHTFTVPVGADEAFTVLRDIERIAPCMPGATIESVDGEEFSGRVEVKVGPMQVVYRGTARFTMVDEASHRAVIVAKGSEARGSGTAQATITASLTEAQGTTDVTVVTDLKITGKPAQFGRGVMADVGDKLLGQFADCLSEELAAPAPAAAPAPEPAAAEPAEMAVTAAAPVEPSGGEEPLADSLPPTLPADSAPTTQRRTDEAIDLLGVAGAPVMKRLAPVGAALLLLAVVLWLLRRREDG